MRFAENVTSASVDVVGHGDVVVELTVNDGGNVTAAITAPVNNVVRWTGAAENDNNWS